MKRILCSSGIHKWKYNRSFHIIDIYPGFELNWENPIRICLRCGRIERWLPGYGGSDIGCWCKMTDVNIDYILKHFNEGI
jgi:hypothetical protein